MTTPSLSEGRNDVLARPSGQALVSDEAGSRLHPSGFDPSRETPFAQRRHLKYVPPCDEGGAVRRRWIIVQEPGCIPEKKGHFPYERLEGFLRELIACRPAGTQYTIVSLTWDFDIWVESGREYLTMCEVLAECDSDGGPKGGDACGSVHDSAAIAQNPEGNEP